jgi:hypothetical protein
MTSIDIMSEPTKPLVNRVAASGLITINLEDWYPEAPLVGFDLKDFLFRELILKEKDFRMAMKEQNWSEYEGKYLAVYCSTDAIIPVWAYMLVASQAQPYARDIYFGSPKDFYRDYYRRQIDQMDMEPYTDKRIVVKGCSDKAVPPSAYMDLTRRLRPIALSIMYGEPCSTVPVYKRKKG